MDDQKYNLRPRRIKDRRICYLTGEKWHTDAVILVKWKSDSEDIIRIATNAIPIALLDFLIVSTNSI